jgi:NAD(P) transhydrogenase subunit beta
MAQNIIPLGYLVATAFFIFGIKRLSKVRTARGGNQISAWGMLLAVVLTFIDINLNATGSVFYGYIIAGLVLGGLIGAVAATRVEMTQMPEMVAIFNGFGGMGSALVGLSVVWRDVTAHLSAGHTGPLHMAEVMGGVDVAVTIVLSLLVGALTLTGSLVAYAKLAGKMTGNPVLLPGRHVLNVALLLFSLVVAGMLAFGTFDGMVALYLCLGVLAAALVLGVMAVIPIGGADMPVVISLLNSYSGIAAAMTGFVLRNNLLIVSGSLVGASGIILTQIMCKAMNRSLANVLFGGFGGETSSAAQSAGYTNISEAGPEEMAMMLEDAESVVFVPGYGLAVAQAQHVTKELADLLEKRGTKVRYAIHPVAGRMPGHMNVLLAEADVPYEQLIEMDEINPEFKSTDVVIILGANDVVNPAAINDPTSPIAGMPILNTHEARTVFIIKRSLASGFAGIRNELFDYDNAIMVFGDAKKVLTDVVAEVKEAS